VAGGGSLPGRTLSTILIAISHPRPNDVAAALRHHDPPVVARIEQDTLLIDLRTVSPEDDVVIIEALRSALDGR